MCKQKDNSRPANKECPKALVNAALIDQSKIWPNTLLLDIVRINARSYVLSLTDSTLILANNDISMPEAIILPEFDRDPFPESNCMVGKHPQKEG